MTRYTYGWTDPRGLFGSALVSTYYYGALQALRGDSSIWGFD